MNADVVASPTVSASPLFTFQKPRNAATSMTVIGTSVWTGRALQAECDDLEMIGLSISDGEPFIGGNLLLRKPLTRSVETQL